MLFSSVWEVAVSNLLQDWQHSLLDMNWSKWWSPNPSVWPIFVTSYLRCTEKLPSLTHPQECIWSQTARLRQNRSWSPSTICSTQVGFLICSLSKTSMPWWAIWEMRPKVMVSLIILNRFSITSTTEWKSHSRSFSVSHPSEKPWEFELVSSLVLLTQLQSIGSTLGPEMPSSMWLRNSCNRLSLRVKK